MTGIEAELVVVLMMLLDDEASVMLDQQGWCRQWSLRGWPSSFH